MLKRKTFVYIMYYLKPLTGVGCDDIERVQEKEKILLLTSLNHLIEKED